MGDAVVVDPVLRSGIEQLVVGIQPPTEEVVIRVHDVAPQPALSGQLLADRRPAVREHPAEQGGRRTVPADLPEEASGAKSSGSTYSARS